MSQPQLDIVYYFIIRETNSKIYQTLVATLEPYLEVDDDGVPRVFVPDVSAVKDGKIVARFEMEKAPESESKEAVSYWTAQRQQRAVKNLQGLIAKLR